MKLLFPVLLAALTAACAPPKPGTYDHQRQLAKEARENFYAMKEQERLARQPARKEKLASVELKPFAASTPAEPPPRPRIAPAKPLPKPAPSINPYARLEKSRTNDDTVYYFDVPRGTEPDSPRYRAYKARYARELAKRPEDLTSEEREWVRRHYRD